MQSSLLLLLLSCPWQVYCNRKPPSHSLERDQPSYSPESGQPYHSLERVQPYFSLERRSPRYSLTHQDTLKRSQPKNMRSPKSVENTGCIPTDGTAYTGKANTTESGLTCQMWSVDTPHEHPFNDTGEHNYCRSPDGDKKVWCYTTDPGTRWEYCDVPVCVTFTKGI